MLQRFVSSARYRGFVVAHGVRHLVFWAGAIAVAGTSILFASVSAQAFSLFGLVMAVSPGLALVVCPAGFAFARCLTRDIFPGAEGSGIPQAIAAIQQDNKTFRLSVLSLRVAVGKIALTILGLGCGASIGREGPSVQVGAAIMYNLGRLAKLPPRDMSRAVILAGGAAGISAAFNTPLAGIVFAIEELSRSFEERTSGRVFTAVIVSGIVSLAALGNYSYFGKTEATLDLGDGWVPVLVCGAIGGAMGGVFARLLIHLAQGLPGELGRWRRDHPVAVAALCGVAIALIGLASHGDTFGTGYDQTRAVLANQPISPGWGAMKFLATLLSYASGIPGGIFAPSLAVGAGIGVDLAGWMPHVPFGAVVILAMVSYFTGVVQAPITAVIIMLEMIDDVTMTIPVMAAALIALGVSRLVCPKPLYKTLAEGFARPVRELAAQ
jgi:H+/Cl- antiporter ClcA